MGTLYDLSLLYFSPKVMVRLTRTVSGHSVTLIKHGVHPVECNPGACFSKVSKLFGPISGATIPFISSQRRASKPSNFAILPSACVPKIMERADDIRKLID